MKKWEVTFTVGPENLLSATVAGIFAPTRAEAIQHARELLLTPEQWAVTHVVEVV